MPEILVAIVDAEKKQLAQNLATHRKILVMSYKEILADYEYAAELATGANGLILFPFDLNQKLFSHDKIKSRLYDFVRLIAMKPSSITTILLPVPRNKDKPTDAKIDKAREVISGISSFLHPMFGGLPEKVIQLSKKKKTINTTINPDIHMTPKPIAEMVEDNYPHTKCCYNLLKPQNQKIEAIGFWNSVIDDISIKEGVFAARYEVRTREGGPRIYYILPACIYSKNWNRKKSQLVEKLCQGIYEDGLAHAGLYPPDPDIPAVTKVIIEDNGITIYGKGKQKYKLGAKSNHNVGRAARLLIMHRLSNKWGSGYFNIEGRETVNRLTYATLKAAVAKLNNHPKISCGIKFFRSARENKHDKKRGWRFEPLPKFTVINKTSK